MWEWRVRESRPRIWLDEQRLAWLRRKVETGGIDVKPLTGRSPQAQALAYLATGDEAFGRAAIEEALAYSSGTGWIYATAAIAYDWCYPLLTREEKLRLREVFVREGLKRILHRDAWASFRHTFHTNACDVGITAIALAGDDPFGDYALAFLKTRYSDAMRVFDEVFPDGEWGEGFDLNRSATGSALRFLWALKTATGDDLMAGSPHFRSAAQYIIACAKPNGLVYPGGDNDYPFLNDRDREMLLMLAAEFRDPYAQCFLNHCRLAMFETKRPHGWKDLLWYDPQTPERPLDEIPRSRIFRGQGLVAARSAWGWDDGDERLAASWMAFRCGPYFGRSSHYDNNSFEIYYKGELAIDSGRQDDDSGLERSPEDIRKSQYFNYYRRTIAHNSVLIYNPNEVMEMGVINDGGQKELQYVGGVRNEPEHFDLREYSLEERRAYNDWARTPERWDTGRMLAYSGNNLYTYACGDATKSYADFKVSAFVRQIVFVQPDLVVVFDRVGATDPTDLKTWLLHSIFEPKMRRDGAFELGYDAGRLVCVPVLPEKRSVAKTGGKGREFMVGGVCYACGPSASSGRRAPMTSGELPGAWRVEVSPVMPSEEDYFLNVMLLTDRDSKAIPVVTREDDADSVTLSISLPYQRRTRVSFARGPKPSARLIIEDHGRPLFDGPLPDSVVLEKGRI